ncbi:Kelch repeat-containing protein [Labilibaculum antarcticum]|uniref:DNA-binding transcriptional activator n=1 Tax=Labilibaculum antarcticum TaxID=1717717 RepID=A0A1Y1CQK0_9BACT|nr:hypothetical protein [Labilibaculum antarcticum]BAX82708.1 hypothetical protein ALGA_4418 [Labilibaculum antarcticum]
MRFLVALITLIISSLHLYADHGIYFKSNEVSKENRTGVDITHKNNISYTNNFTISFMLSLRQTDTHYGEIMSLKEENGNNLIQVTYREPDLYVIHNKKETKFHCNFNELNLARNRWVSFELKIDSENGDISFRLGDHHFKNSIEFPTASEFSLSLGVINKYGFYIDEVPSMSIKDLAIHVDGTPKHLWPFRKTDNDKVKDILSSRTAKIYNPDWVIDYHNQWTKVKTLSFPSMPSMAYDKKNEVIYFVLENGDTHTYSLKTNALTTNKKKSGFPVFEKSQQLIINNKNQLVSYSLNHNDFSIYNPENQIWSHSDSVTNDLPKWWHHNKLIHPITNQITTLCGYGYYSYSNSIKSFNEKSKSWTELKLKGDLFEPRYCSSLGFSAENSNVVYLFGGLGNSLGKQILGKEFYYDLYKIDFKKKEIKKLWELKRNDQFQYLPVNSLKITEKDSAFYTLLFSCQKSSTHLKVAKGFINDPKLSFIGDSIPYEFVDIKSFADLYYWKSENKLIALTSQETDADAETYEVSMYSISYEPGADIELNMESHSLPLSIKLFYIFLAGILLLLVFYVRGKVKARIKNEKIEKTPIFTIPEKLSTYEIPQLNSILLFGGFQVFDNNSKDITYRFSPTLKELFLLILLYSLEDGKGISSRRIQEYLWPDKSEDKAKNNRGVNIKKLRSILEDIQGVEITFDNNYWKMILEKNVFCDLASIQNSIASQITNSDSNKIEEIIQILYRGTLLRDIVPEWLDSFKDKATGTIVSTLEEMVTKFSFESSIRLAISNVIFEFDPMNETALRVKCSLLSIQGKHSIAMETYENYRKLYVKLYNEEYQFSFKDIVSENTTI